MRHFLKLAAVALLSGAAVCWSRLPSHPSAAEAVRQARDAPAGMVYVPAGWCVLGADDPEETDSPPAHRAYLPAYYIDRFEVTNAQFRQFRPRHSFPSGEDELPVTNLPYEEADAYARWAGKRLPTNDEWEKAARGTDGRRYPWGNQWSEARVAPRARRKPRTQPLPGQHCLVSRVQRVGSVPAGVSPYGCLDMAGNAWEWVFGFNGDNKSQRLIRGGAVSYGERACRTYARGIEGSGVT